MLTYFGEFRDWYDLTWIGLIFKYLTWLLIIIKKLIPELKFWRTENIDSGIERICNPYSLLQKWISNVTTALQDFFLKWCLAKNNSHSDYWNHLSTNNKLDIYSISKKKPTFSSTIQVTCSTNKSIMNIHKYLLRI